MVTLGGAAEAPESSAQHLPSAGRAGALVPDGGSPWSLWGVEQTPLHPLPAPSRCLHEPG